MRLLVVIPCLYNGEMCKEAIASVVNKEFVSVLLIDNGAETGVNKVIDKFSELSNVHVIKNKTNLYVNPAWNQGLQFFLSNSEFTHIVIMNSDLVMHKQWDKVLMNRLAENPHEITLPIVIDDKFFGGAEVDTSVAQGQKVDSGTPGIFIVLSRNQVEVCYPIPSEIVVWFGDNFLFDTLRGIGYETVIANNLLCYHAHSQTVQRVPGISEIIEEDKRQWETSAKQKMLDLIQRHKA